MTDRDRLVAEMPDAEWCCGAFQPTTDPALAPYRCTEPAGHAGDHRATIGITVVAQWPRTVRRQM